MLHTEQIVSEREIKPVRNISNLGRVFKRFGLPFVHLPERRNSIARSTSSPSDERSQTAITAQWVNQECTVAHHALR